MDRQIARDHAVPFFLVRITVFIAALRMMARIQHAAGPAAACVAILWIGLNALGSSASAQTFTRYTYTGTLLLPVFSSCPSNIGNTTVTVDYYNSATPYPYGIATCRVNGNVMPGEYLSRSYFNVKSGNVSYTYFSCSHLSTGPPSPVPVGTNDKGVDIVTARRDLYIDYTLIVGNYCDYESVSPGVWSAGTSVGPAKMLGRTSADAHCASCEVGNPINAATETRFRARPISSARPTQA